MEVVVHAGTYVLERPLELGHGGPKAAGPASGYRDVRVKEARAFRYLRCLSPADPYGNIAEVEFHGRPAGGGGPEARLLGRVIGTEGSWNNAGNTREKAFDGDPATLFDAPDAAASSAWVG